MRDTLWPTLLADERGLLPDEEPWRALANLGERLAARWPADDAAGAEILVDRDSVIEGAHLSARYLWVGAGVCIEPGAVVVGEWVFLAPGAHVRAHAYVRGPAYIGERAVVGHTTEVKNSILLHGAKAPHFAYVGDSILGPAVNLGAGTKLSNVRLDGREVKLGWQGRRQPSGSRKLGALLGEGVQTGCNAVLNPGTILGPGVFVPPCTAVGGTHMAPGMVAERPPRTRS